MLCRARRATTRAGAASASGVSETRSRTMRAVRSSNTGPELEVRRLLHRAGFRYRLHVASLPGSPDPVFPGRRCVVFVHGCFGTSTEGAAARAVRERAPATGCPNLNRNVERDRRVAARLRRSGWSVCTVWECQLRWHLRVLRRLTAFLDRSRS
ncbi:MAG: very short patch repair endonuclease [Planctomycetota bacterium]